MLLVAQYNGLEKGKVGICLHGLLKDIIALHLVLIGFKGLCDGGLYSFDAQIGTLDDVANLRLKCLLHACQLLDFTAVLASVDLILGGHCRIGGLDVHGFGGVDAHIDHLSGNTQAIEIRGFGGLFTERETPILA